MSDAPGTLPGPLDERQKLLHRANQVAEFFAAYPRDEAIAAVAEHFQLFWEPRIRARLRRYTSQEAGGLHELVVEAVRTLEGQA